MFKLKKFFNRNIYPYIFKLFPIDQKKIVISSYGGNFYSGNPKSISEYLYSQNKEIKIVWLLKKRYINKDKIPKYVKIVDYESLMASYELFTAKIWIDNIRKTLSVKKRQKTYYIQTWHGTPLKLIEADAKEKLSLRYQNYAKKDTENIDLLISGNKYSTNIFKSAFLYDREILEVGTPRNDILINKTKNNFKIKNKMEDKCVILFAPTFRNDIKDNGIVQLLELNVKELLKKFSEMYKKECILLTRFHPNVVQKIKFDNNYKNIRKLIKDVSDYDNLEELLLGIDILITDYSSILFDFCLLKKPIILFVPDEKKYKEERGMYINLEELPILKFNNSEDMIKELSGYQIQELDNKTEELLKKIGSYETGKATQIIGDRILNLIKYEKRDEKND